MKLVFVAILFAVAAMSAQSQRIEYWISQPRNNIFLQRQSDLTFVSSSGGSTSYSININDALRYQQMDGFGGSMTDASCWLFKYRLSASKRAEVLENLFGPSGINLSLLRQPIGASDFGWEAWSLDDTNNNADDFQLNNFYLWREDDYIRPMLDLALAVNRGRIKLFASPWSPPAWMKTQKHLNGNIGGVLRPDCYNVYADYFVKYLKEYANHGSPVYAITIQNEPLYAPSYPGMLMSANEQSNFIHFSLGPKLRANGLNTKIVIYDHNWDDAGVAYVDTVLNNLNANPYIAGVGFHPYTSQINHQAMTQVHNRYNKEVWLTEAGSGTWIGDNTAQFQDQMMHLVRVPRNWGKGVIFWNIALDQNSSPKLAGVDSSASNRGFVTIRSDVNDAVTYEMSYYSIGHSSKFVNPGAYRIDSTSWLNDLETVAYLNSDNTIVLVVSNRGTSRKDLRVTWKTYEARLSIEATSAATLKWAIF